MKKWAIVAACVGVAAIVLAVTVLRPSEEDQIRALLARFTKALVVKPNDNVIVRTGRLKSELKETVTDDVYVDAPDLNVRVGGRPAVVDAAVKAGLVFQSADCALTGETIKVDEKATTAKVEALAVVTAAQGDEQKVAKRNVHFLLRKDGAWKITTIDVAPAQPE